MGRKRRKFTGKFKAQVALEALRGDRTIQGEADQKTIEDRFPAERGAA